MRGKKKLRFGIRCQVRMTHRVNVSCVRSVVTLCSLHTSKCIVGILYPLEYLILTPTFCSEVLWAHWALFIMLLDPAVSRVSELSKKVMQEKLRHSGCTRAQADLRFCSLVKKTSPQFKGEASWTCLPCKSNATARVAVNFIANDLSVVLKLPYVWWPWIKIVADLPLHFWLFCCVLWQIP